MQSETINLKDYTQKGVSFNTYYEHIENVAAQDENEVELHEYYVLNLQRIHRLRKRVKLSETQLEQLQTIQRNVSFLIITEGWCGDAAQILPVVEKMVEASDKIEAKIVYRDENPDLMDAYLTNGGKSIPIIVGVDTDSGEQIFRWGPRPAFGTALLKKFKAGETTKEEFHLDLQKAYNKDNGATIINELLENLK